MGGEEGGEEEEDFLIFPTTLYFKKQNMKIMHILDKHINYEKNN